MRPVLTNHSYNAVSTNDDNKFEQLQSANQGQQQSFYYTVGKILRGNIITKLVRATLNSASETLAAVDKYLTFPRAEAILHAPLDTTAEDIIDQFLAKYSHKKTSESDNLEYGPKNLLTAKYLASQLNEVLEKLTQKKAPDLAFYNSIAMQVEKIDKLKNEYRKQIQAIKKSNETTEISEADKKFIEEEDLAFMNEYRKAAATTYETARKLIEKDLKRLEVLPKLIEKDLKRLEVSPEKSRELEKMCDKLIKTMCDILYDTFRSESVDPCVSRDEHAMRKMHKDYINSIAIPSNKIEPSSAKQLDNGSKDRNNEL